MTRYRKLGRRPPLSPPPSPQRQKLGRRPPLSPLPLPRDRTSELSDGGASYPFDDDIAGDIEIGIPLELQHGEGLLHPSRMLAAASAWPFMSSHVPNARSWRRAAVARPARYARRRAART
jgi:hypothetical protein